MGIAGAVIKDCSGIVDQGPAQNIVHPVIRRAELGPVAVPAAPFIPFQAGGLGQQMPQRQVVLPGILLFQHLREVIRHPVIHPADVSLVDCNADQRPGKGFGGRVQLKKTVLIVAVPIVLVDVTPSLTVTIVWMPLPGNA